MKARRDAGRAGRAQLGGWCAARVRVRVVEAGGGGGGGWGGISREWCQLQRQQGKPTS